MKPGTTIQTTLLCLLLLPAGVGRAAPEAAAPAAVSAAAGPAINPAQYPAREKGVRAFADGIYDIAQRFFLDYRDAAGFQEPAFADATVLLVQTNLRQGRTTEAAAALALHQANSPGLTLTSYQDALAGCRGALLMALGDWQGAEQTLLPLTTSERAPDVRGQALEGLANVYFRLQKWPEAEAAFTRLLTEFPVAESRLRAQLGLIKVALAGNQTARAVEFLAALEKATPPPPAGTIALYRILILLEEKQWEQAWKAFTEFQVQMPLPPGDDSWLVTSHLGAELMANGRYAEALNVFETARTLTTTVPDRIQVRLRIAECLIALERMEPAISALELFRKDFPGAAELFRVEIKLADLLRHGGSLLTAADYYGSVAENEKAEPDLRYRAAYNRADCFRAAGQWANASQAFSRAAKLGATPEQQADCLFQAAEASFKVGNFTNAALLYQNVADTYPATKLAEQARFNQGISRLKENQFSNAAMILKQFLEAYPASTLAPQARLQRGAALRNSGDFSQAIAELDEFVKKNPQHELAPQALMEAEQAAFGLGNPVQAIQFLTRLMTDYSASPLFPRALYQRAHLRFFLMEYPAALEDCEAFLDAYPQMPLAADVLIWLGDYYINQGDRVKGEDYYLQLAGMFVDSPLAPGALLDAARSAYSRDNWARAGTILGQLLRDYAASAAPDLIAQAALLQGDLLAQQGKFTEAIPQFTKVTELMPNTAVAFAATGRLGEMIYSAGETPENLERARVIFENLAATPAASDSEREKAHYRLAKVLEKQTQNELAIKEYLGIVYQYDMDLKAGRVRDWYYFARAGYDAARLLVLADRFLEAARLYERLAAAKIPTAVDALAKAKEIRTAHNLND